MKPRIVLLSALGALLAGCGGSGDDGGSPAPALPTSVVFGSPPPNSLAVNAQVTLSATAVYGQFANGNGAVTWSVTCGSPGACGSFGPNDAAGSVTYTAPAAIPSGTTVSVTATSVADPGLSATGKIDIVGPIPITVTLEPTPTTSVQVGATVPFSAMLGNQSSFVTGVFVANNGAVTGGEQDSLALTTDSDGNTVGSTQFEPITGGSYMTLPDGTLQVSLTLQDGGVEMIAGTQAQGGKGFVGGINGMASSATLEPQTLLAAPSAGYAIALFGGDAEGSPLWLAGVLNVDGSGSISGAGSSIDVVDGVTELTGTYSVTAGSVSTPDAYGRVLLQLTPQGSGSLQPVTLAAYSVDTAHSRLIETGDLSNDATFDGVFGGIALAQGASTGGFTAAAVAGTTYVLGAQGQDQLGPLQIAGLFTLHGDGSVTGLLNWTDLTATGVQRPLSFTGTYTLDPTGQLTLTHLTDHATFDYSMNVFLAAGGSAVLLSNDSNDAFTGQAFQQQDVTATAPPAAVGLNATVWSPDAAASGAS